MPPKNHSLENETDPKSRGGNSRPRAGRIRDNTAIEAHKLLDAVSIGAI